MSTRFGFVGLGIMGERMARRLAAHQTLPLPVWSRSYRPSRDPGAEKEAARFHAVASPAEVAARSEVVFTMLSDGPTTMAVLEGGDGVSGVLDGLAPGGLVVNCATVGPGAARALAERAHSREIAYLDAPVLGSRDAAEAGALRFLVGGERLDIHRARPALDSMGRDITHLGPVGTGSAAKLVINSLLGAGMAAFADAVGLGRMLGVPDDFLLETVLRSAVVPSALHEKGKVMASQGEDVHFPLRWMRKDLSLALAAGAHEADMPLLRAALATYDRAMADGLGDLDFAAIAYP